MACFIVPATEAIVTTIVTKCMQHHEQKTESKAVLPFSEKLGWLNKMLWGGSALLAFEHLWHGEISPFYPFLTAAADPAEASVMLHEMATSGVAMALLVTAVWGVLTAFVSRRQRRTQQDALPMKQEVQQS